VKRFVVVNFKASGNAAAKSNMPKFMVQVVLHDAKASAYDGLTVAMEKRGFVAELPGRKTSYHLPNGSYWYNGDITPSDLRLRAAAAAEKTGEEFGIAVVRANGWSVMGLKRVEAASQD
jgi:hypothetical protein